MPPSQPELPSPPPNFHRLAWHGMTLLLPEDWNLTHHEGTPKKGALLFADLRAPRLALRWKSPLRNNPGASLQKTLTRLRHRFPGKPEALTSNAFKLTRDTQTLALFADLNRLYELEFPAPSSHTDFILQDFLEHTPPLAAASHWFWSLYGATGWLPREAKLTQTSLLPGETRLTFSINRLPATLASHSLADHLLATQTLRTWALATIPLIRKYPKGDWEESADCLTYSIILKHGLIRPHPVTHCIHITHDPIANRIRWTHDANRAKT